MGHNGLLIGELTPARVGGRDGLPDVGTFNLVGEV